MKDELTQKLGVSNINAISNATATTSKFYEAKGSKLLKGALALAFALPLAYGLNAKALNDKELLEQAKVMGLSPIPSDTKALKKLIEDSSPESKKYPATKQRVELGKKLYFDPRVSKSGLISCNTCHNIGLGGADGVEAAIGHKWRENPHHLNSPTVFNSVFNSVQFYDGRALHLADQAKGPMQADVEMGSTPDLIENRILSIPAYKEEFEKAFGKKEKINFDLIAVSIGIFERSLVTPSRFDKFLEGDTKALSKDEKEGLKVFLDKGCAACHTGVNLGGTMQPFEIASKYEFANVGDFKGDSNGLVKTPTLRNIALTAPYFHNGAVWDLKDAIKMMGSIQLGINLSDSDAKKIEVFLNSLTGKLKDITYPIFPASTAATPRPITQK